MGIKAGLLGGALALIACPAGAEFAPGCDADLVAVDQSFAETLSRLAASRDAVLDVKCAAYRHHIEVMISARDVFMRGLPDGRGRSENVGQMDDSIEDFRYVLADQGCD
jgi:hypothetical protein